MSHQGQLPCSSQGKLNLLNTTPLDALAYSRMQRHSGLLTTDQVSIYTLG